MAKSRISPIGEKIVVSWWGEELYDWAILDYLLYPYEGNSS